MKAKKEESYTDFDDYENGSQRLLYTKKFITIQTDFISLKF